MAQKLLSIVVPTKNRYYYLKYLIGLINNLHSDEIEMVIQDNSDDNSEILEYLEQNRYEFIRYDYTKGQIPMSDNSDKGILNSTGEYICFLGDDDGVTKYLLEGVKWMKKNGIEAVKPAHLNYFWPDAPQGNAAIISHKDFTGKVEFRNPKEELIKVLKGGIQGRGDMPLAYHAVVCREAMNKVYEKCGTFFPGNSPDISNAVALSLVVEKFALVDLPWGYSGNSAYKGGGVFASGNAIPMISDIPWFRPNSEVRWDKKLPRIAIGNLIWADSALEALNNMGMETLRNKFDLYLCYANLISSKPELKKYVDEVCSNSVKLYLYLTLVYAKKISNAIILRFKKICHFKPSIMIEKDINNIVQATSKLEILSDGIMHLNH